MPVDPSVAHDFQTFINDQRTLGIDVKFLLESAVSSPELLRDLMIVDKPQIATEAFPTAGRDDYESVSLFFETSRVSEFGQIWKQLDLLASPCTADDCVERALSAQASGVNAATRT